MSLLFELKCSIYLHVLVYTFTMPGLGWPKTIKSRTQPIKIGSKLINTFYISLKFFGSGWTKIGSIWVGLVGLPNSGTPLLLSINQPSPLFFSQITFLFLCILPRVVTFVFLSFYIKYTSLFYFLLLVVVNSYIYL